MGMSGNDFRNICPRVWGGGGVAGNSNSVGFGEKVGKEGA